MTMQANHTATDGTIGVQVNDLISAFTSCTATLASTAISSGSTTVDPTNDEISLVYADVMQYDHATYPSRIRILKDSFISG